MSELEHQYQKTKRDEEAYKAMLEMQKAKLEAYKRGELHPAANVSDLQIGLGTLGAGLQAQQTPVANRPLEIPAAFQRLTDSTQVLEQVLLTLEDRLNPVLRHDPQTVGKDQCSQPCSTALGSAITDIGTRISRQCERISSMLDRLEA